MPALTLTLALCTLAAGAALIAWGLLGDRSRGRRRCPRCWYDLDAVPGATCPECGRAARNEREFHRTRRRWKLAILGLAVMAAGLAIAAVPAIRAGTWVRSVPTTALVWFFPAAIEQIETPGRDWPGVAKQLLEETARRAETGRMWVWQRRTLVNDSVRIYERTTSRDARREAHRQLIYSSAYIGPLVPRVIDVVAQEGYEPMLLACAHTYSRAWLPDRRAVIDRLFTALESGKLRTLSRVDTVNVLLQLRADEARLLPHITAMIKDQAPLAHGPDRTEHVYGVTNLARVPSQFGVTIPMLIELAGSEDALTSRCAVEALAEVGPPAAPAVPILIERLRAAQDRGMVLQIARALANMGPAARAAAPAIAEKLSAPESTESRALRIALLRTTGKVDEAAELLAAWAAHADESMRAEAVWHLEQFMARPDLAVPILAGLATDSASRPVQLQAIRAINKFGPAGAMALPELSTLIAPGADTSMLLILADSLEDLGPELARARPLLRKLARHESPSVRNQAAGLLLQLRHARREKANAK